MIAPKYSQGLTAKRRRGQQNALSRYVFSLFLFFSALVSTTALPSAAAAAARLRRDRCRACSAGAADLLRRDRGLVLAAAAVAALPRAARRAREERVVGLVSDAACGEEALLDFTAGGDDGGGGGGGGDALAAGVDAAAGGSIRRLDTRRMQRLCREAAEDDEGGFERALVRGGADADEIRRSACAVACKGVSEEDATRTFNAG